MAKQKEKKDKGGPGLKSTGQNLFNVEAENCPFLPLNLLLYIIIVFFSAIVTFDM